MKHRALSAEEIENLPEQYASHVFVGRITTKAGEAQIREALEGFGEIVRVNVAKDHRGHKGFAFAVFRSKDEAKEVLRNGPEVNIERVDPAMARNGRTITVGPYIYSERQKAFENNQLEEYKKHVDDTPTTRSRGKAASSANSSSTSQNAASTSGNLPANADAASNAPAATTAAAPGNDLALPGLPPEGESGATSSGGLALLNDDSGQPNHFSNHPVPPHPPPGPPAGGTGAAAGAKGLQSLQLADREPALQPQAPPAAFHQHTPPPPPPQPPASAAPAPTAIAANPPQQPQQPLPAQVPHAPPHQQLQPATQQQQQQQQHYHPHHQQFLHSQQPQQALAQQQPNLQRGKRKRYSALDDDSAKREISKMQDNLRHIVVAYYREALAMQGNSDWHNLVRLDELFTHMRATHVQDLEERRSDVFGAPKDSSTPQLSHHQPYLQPVWRPESVGFSSASTQNPAPIPHQQHPPLTQRQPQVPQQQQGQAQAAEPQRGQLGTSVSQSTGAPSSVAASSSEEMVPKWYYRDPQGQQHGPFSLSQLRQWSSNLPQDLGIWQDGALTTAPLSYVLSGQENASLSDSNANVWKYLDTSGKMQGPFSLGQLVQWQQFFPPRHTVFTDGRAPVELSTLLNGGSVMN